jgi:hypothetical protein
MMIVKDYIALLSAAISGNVRGRGAEVWVTPTFG